MSLANSMDSDDWEALAATFGFQEPSDMKAFAELQQAKSDLNILESEGYDTGGLYRADTSEIRRVFADM